MIRLIYNIIDLFIFSIFIGLFAISCILGYKRVNNEALYIAPELRDHFEDFKRDAKKYGAVPNYSGLTTNFTIINDDITLGYCVPKFNIVKIDINKWKHLDADSKKLLLYHEWAHCTMRRDHYEAQRGLCPRSIMYPYLTPIPYCYKIFKFWYDKELFTNPDKAPLIGEGDL